MTAPDPRDLVADGATRANATMGNAPESVGEGRSIGELIGKVTTDLSTLMRQELELAKAEAKQTATRAGAGAGMFAGAAVAGLLVLIFISTSLWWSIGVYTGHGWSALIVALIWAIIGAVLAIVGRSQFQRAKGIPRTTDTVSKIPAALKGNEQENH